MKFHNWIIEERSKLTAHSANPFEVARVAAALSPAERKRRVEGIVIFATSRIVIDDVGVRQLGGLASELAKQTAERAQEQQDVVLRAAQQLSIESLYKLPPLGVLGATETDAPETGPGPAAAGETEAGQDGPTAGDDASS